MDNSARNCEIDITGAIDGLIFFYTFVRSGKGEQAALFAANLEEGFLPC